MAKPLPWTGGCRCGRLRFEVTEPPLLTSACHCNGCQRMTASAFSLTTAVPASGFRVTEGDPVIGGMHGPVAHHFFCGHCMSWVYTTAEGADWFVNLRPTTLDEHGDFSPFVEFHTSTKLPWVSLPAVRSFDEFPPFEAYDGLAKEFAERQVAAR